jgi:ATP-dependent Clp protease ATP-binding subunit ClpC
MDYKFSQKIKDVLTYSREEAIRLGNSSVSPEHLFLGILRDGEGLAIEVLLALGLDLVAIKKELENKLRAEAPCSHHQLR